MPTYEFRCEAGHSFDRFLKMSEAPLELACTECGKPARRQMSGGAGLVFKGSGFYLTDYGRSGQKPPAAEAGASASEGGATDSETKTGAKPAKTETSPAAPAATKTRQDKGSSSKSTKPGE